MRPDGTTPIQVLFRLFRSKNRTERRGHIGIVPVVPDAEYRAFHGGPTHDRRQGFWSFTTSAKRPSRRP